MSRTKAIVDFMIKGTKPKSYAGDSGEISSNSPHMDDGFVKAFEVVLTPILFCLLGVFLDYKFDTAPILTLGFLFFGIAGMVIKLWYKSFAPESSLRFLQNEESSSRVVRRSQIKPVEMGELLGGDLEVPSDLDLTLDNGSEIDNGDR